MTRRLRTWLPVAVVPAVVIVGVLTVPLQAGAAVDLPDKTPAQVLAMIGDSNVKALSGTIEQTSELGLPSLPSTGSGADASASSALELLTGSHTARIYLNAPDNVRVQVMDRLAERDLVRNASDVWMYNSKDNTALHVTLPDMTGMARPQTDGAQQTPAQLAERMLAAIDPSTAVTVGKDTRVAGRTAYELRLTPRTDATLVGEVSIAVDSETGMPLRVEVQARGQSDPAFSLAFTKLSLDAPSADLFDFTPPAGAKVEEKTLPDPSAIHDLAIHDSAMHHSALHDKTMTGTKMPATPEEAKKLLEQLKAEQPKNGGGMLPGVTVDGTGWASVVELPAGTVTADVLANPLLAQVTESVDGGRLLSTALVTVLVTDDGRVFAGSVPAERLQAAAVGG
ncbi:outer membrane lipoprotein-sorting protein [Cryobacterium sp. MP_M5]|uniref:LolA family protein n=1 Tax=unclassified Cryobacterium TaxID=2649013 RepID=UPI0018C9B7DB|nr:MULTISPECIES: sigma-E factor regulatory protein RseB domain-containing protein [unclassified Cryobacterium]MBG6059031.1 outer membrane lipoprotein-sorting protein [Cryobacterium sp. MP_M3]MEC5177325.1 outer membrane lipoprotein-sorting protein [Cryobacterium sp. MP_M5]